MGISRYNAEGYYDPVPYEAIHNLEKKSYRPMVYVCAPLSGDLERNRIRAENYARYVTDHGGIPITPHLLFSFMDDRDPDDRELALFMDLVLLTKCRELWVFGKKITGGMAVEIAKASSRDMTIRYIRQEE